MKKQTNHMLFELDSTPVVTKWITWTVWTEGLCLTLKAKITTSMPHHYRNVTSSGIHTIDIASTCPQQRDTMIQWDYNGNLPFSSPAQPGLPSAPSNGTSKTMRANSCCGIIKPIQPGERGGGNVRPRPPCPI